jgi:hypothetical protein
MIDTTRRDYVLDRALREGRISQGSRAHWVNEYDRNPTGTETLLAALAPLPGAGVLGHDAVQATVDAGRALVQPYRRPAQPVPAAAAHEPVQAQHMRPVEQPATDIELTPENVARWSAELFPETRAGRGPQQGRVTRDQTYKRNAATA